ncbi:MAG: hypothetical protein EOO38_10520 [Cytophagaceae bacterium]|jgi:hypothetical protein|nr:MAG: hypothetical protein EOO38_10520 [Cytophagaceae bacterium]
MNRKALVLSSLLLLLITGEVRASVEFPSQLRGFWDLGPAQCRLPVNSDADSPIEITARAIHAYEHTENPLSVKRVSSKVQAWVISTDSDVAPGLVVYDLYVLKGDHLTITDGETTRSYKRCR